MLFLFAENEIMKDKKRETSCVIKRRYRIVIYLLETFFHPIFKLLQF